MEKDFQYYAKKAEHQLTKDNRTAQDVDWAIARAGVYARLAAAAPKKTADSGWPMRDND